MNLGRLRGIVDQLIEELGVDEPVAAFLFTAACLDDDIPPATVARILNQFQYFHGDPPLEDYLRDELDDLAAEMTAHADDAS